MIKQVPNLRSGAILTGASSEAQKINIILPVVSFILKLRAKFITIPIFLPKKKKILEFLTPVTVPHLNFHVTAVPKSP